MKTRSYGITWLLLSLLLLTPGASAQRVNLAKFQDTTSDSVRSGNEAWEATDGLAHNDSRWASSDGAGPHWLRVDFPFPVQVGSAQAFMGTDGNDPIRNFRIEFNASNAWHTVAGSVVTNNTSVDRNILFTRPVVSDRFRFISDDAETIRLRELALYPPNGRAPYPLGTDVVLNLAWMRETLRSSFEAPYFSKRAVDGFIDTRSRWVSVDNSGDDWFEVELSSPHRLGSAHVYTGWNDSNPDEEFKIRYHDGNAWQDIPGGHITGNTSNAVVVDFATEVTASRIRYWSPGSGQKRLKELVLFAANGGTGYPLGTGVNTVDPLPTVKFTDFDDAYWRIRNVAAGNIGLAIEDQRGVIARESTPDHDRHFQILLNVGTDTFRIRNRASGKCLTVTNPIPGSTVVEMDYTGLPHQNWQVASIGSNQHQIRNVLTGFSLQTDTSSPGGGSGVIQGGVGDLNHQKWSIVKETHYPKKGIAGWLNHAAKMKAHWGYNWDASDGTIGGGGLRIPMQTHATWPGWGRIPEKRVKYNSRGRVTHHLGYNEPDNTWDPNQNPMSPSKAIELWPRLERLQTPLISPSPASYGSWMNDFMNQAINQRGYQVDYIGVHWYGGPNGGNPQAFIDSLRNLHDWANRPIWISEFSIVDWGGSATWTEEDNYNFFAEFLWRSENMNWLNKYSVFLFNGSVPTNPWDRTGPRGNFVKDDGSFTALGELYAAWDGDTTIRADTPYILHNKKQRKRIRHVAGVGLPSSSWIRRSDASVQWALVDAGNSRHYLVSLEDGMRLRSDGVTVDLAPPGTIGPEVEWDYQSNQYGWFFLEHPNTSTRLQLNDDEEFGLLDDSQTWEGLKWRFIKPVVPSGFDPNPPPPPSLVLLPAGSDWKYWDQGTVPEPSWWSTGFDDSAWPHGPARLGYGNDGEQTQVGYGPDPDQKHVTTYFRTTFTPGDLSTYTRLIISLQRDDGAIVYLNGVEVFRSNLPDGPVSSSTLATSTVSGSSENAWLQAQVDPSLLHSGTNVLAAEVHQATAGSSDLGFDLMLTAELPQPAPVIQVISPQPGGLFGVGQTIPAIVDARDEVSTVQRVDFFLDDNYVGSDATAPYDLNLTELPSGFHDLHAVALNILGGAATSGPVRFQVVPSRTTNALIQAEGIWKFHDRGMDLGTSWRETSYDDTTWGEGFAKLGAGDGAITPINIGPVDNRFPTAYFRRMFDVADASRMTALQFRVLRDDGAVVYLNGTEVFRQNMPEGPISFSTLAATTVSGSNEDLYFETTVPAGALVTGQNLVAVELHQASLDTSDAGFDLVLDGVESILGQYPTRLGVERLPDGNLRISWRSPSPDWILFQGVSLEPGALWRPVPGAVESNSGRHAITVPKLAPYRYYQLRLQAP